MEEIWTVGVGPVWASCDLSDGEWSGDASSQYVQRVRKRVVGPGGRDLSKMERVGVCSTCQNRGDGYVRFGRNGLHRRDSSDGSRIDMGRQGGTWLTWVVGDGQTSGG